MSAPAALPWLLYANEEIANAARTVAYLRAGLAAPSGGSFDVAAAYPCSVLYRVVGGAGPEIFNGPVGDPAPWYDPDVEESGYFLGFVPTMIGGLDSMVSRAVSPRLGGIEGGFLGPQRDDPRPVTVKGWLIAAHPAALDYGFRWLTDKLANNCAACDVADLQVYTACPPDNGLHDDISRYTLYDVGLTNGPKWTGNMIQEESCDVREIEFTLVAENSWLYRPANVCLAAEPVGVVAVCDDPMSFFLGEPGDPHCCPVSSPTLGVRAAVVTIDAPDGVGGLEVGFFGRCPPASDDVALKRIYVEKLLPGQQLTIDSARRRVVRSELIEPDPGTVGTDPVLVVREGSSSLFIPEGEGMQWLEVASCDPDGCFCVRTTSPCSEGATATVQIESQLRVR